MTTIVTRIGKGSPLTYGEMDGNFTNLNNDTVQFDSNGNVGIGTSLPINYPGYINLALDRVGFGSNIDLSNNGTLGLSIYSDVFESAFYEYRAFPLNFYTDGLERMRVASDGNVGIGTTTPARPLHVSDVMRLEPRNGAPSSPSKGDIYFDSADDKLKCYDGTSWQNLF